MCSFSVGVLFSITDEWTTSLANSTPPPHMELGSSSSSSSSPASFLASDSVNGLQFGHKIYFEHVGVAAGGSARTIGGSASLPPPAPAKKGRGGAVQGGQPPRCQVEGCKVDLSDAKSYYSRHKVCGVHSKSPKVIVAGFEQRFCQQCSRFHHLPEFDQGKRSCRRRLAGHNERRRKPPSSSTRYGNLYSSIFENNNRTGSFIMDFTTYPNSLNRTTSSEPTTLGYQVTNPMTKPPLPWHSNNSENPPSGILQGSATRINYTGPGMPSEGCFNGVSNESSSALSLLSNLPWNSVNQQLSLGVNNNTSLGGRAADGPPPMVQHGAANGLAMVQPSGVPMDHFPNQLWGYKETQGSSGLNHVIPDLGLGHISSQGDTSQYPSELDVAHLGGGQFHGTEQSRGYGSSVQHMNWSL